ncbi:serine/arginine repetitive matrix protein 4 [Salmo salar]|uniref:Serine/arginine repetitive matrix protein 4 n=1 Tax=Salmo salar TaxID=8030 RepID=A0A1S3NJS0_SALSA|nr:serine/arginine repetitive matrix protein 4-like [Salmo salar]|eukprot:XP_014015505.1 PREDICTED: serine/arginine repetitive matrix protein 4-like isoform X1 [Salmo salar]
MASLEHQWEKQLFEKFWKGTFKAVATPRPGSIIVASITARRRVISTETTTCQPLKADEGNAEAADIKLDTTTDRNGCIRDMGRRKHGSYHRTRSVLFDDDLSPRPHTSKGKKKRRKSERKRKRERSPYYSLSPVRKKKKKKKKKSSKKSKRHRDTSKKTKHSSSSLKHKRKDDRKHKKSSRRHMHRRRRYRRSESESSTWCSSSTESRRHLHKSVDHPALGGLAALMEDPGTSLDHGGFEWEPAAKSVCKTTPIFRSVLSTSTVLQSKPGGEVLNTTVILRHTLTNQSKGPQDYDSGNDTSSPPSTKTGISQSNVIGNKKVLRLAPASPEKLKFRDGDNASDSGNSVTSYASLCKPLHVEGGLSTATFNGNDKSEPVKTSGCGAKVGRPQKTASISPLRTVASSRKRTKANSSSSSSRSRSRSSGSCRHSGRYSRSRSLSSARSYSRSPSYSAGLRRKGSVGIGRSRGRYSRNSEDRVRERKRDPSSCEKDVKHGSRKHSGKRQKPRSYSPMRKRRRDSPSHLEARRITSARKRPIPYFRPSPSSSSRSTSVSSWSSLFTRSRSPSPSPGLCRSRSRSYSSYRSYSRSSSWNSIFGSRSRSRSYDSLVGYSKNKNRR